MISIARMRAQARAEIKSDNFAVRSIWPSSVVTHPVTGVDPMISFEISIANIAKELQLIGKQCRIFAVLLLCRIGMLGLAVDVTNV